MYLKTRLNEVKSLYKKSKQNRINSTNSLYGKYIDRKIRKIFVNSMVYLLGDYDKYLSYVDNVPLFNEESYLLTREKRLRLFYKELIETQNFNFFLQFDTKLTCPYFDRKHQKYSAHSSIRSNSMSQKTPRLNTRSFIVGPSSRFSSSNVTAFANDEFVSINDSPNNSFIKELESKSLHYERNFIIKPFFCDLINHERIKDGTFLDLVSQSACGLMEGIDFEPYRNRALEYSRIFAIDFKSLSEMPCVRYNIVLNSDEKENPELIKRNSCQLSQLLVKSNSVILEDSASGCNICKHKSVMDLVKYLSPGDITKQYISEKEFNLITSKSQERRASPDNLKKTSLLSNTSNKSNSMTNEESLIRKSSNHPHTIEANRLREEIIPEVNEFRTSDIEESNDKVDDLKRERLLEDEDTLFKYRENRKLSLITRHRGRNIKEM